MFRHLLTLTVLVPLIAACSAAAPGASAPAAAGTGSSPAPSTAPIVPSERPSYALSLPPLATAPATNPPVNGEVPAALMDQAKSDLAKRTGLDPATFTTIRSEQVVWADGSLGCPVPGTMYVQMVTPGYWIQLGAGGTTYDYRSTNAGPVRLCEQPNPKPPSG